MKTFTAVVCLVMTCGLASWAQSPAPQTQPPQFRATVDLMRVDVTVLDKRTRKPVRGLTAEDFEIRVGGTPQAIHRQAGKKVAHAIVDGLGLPPGRYSLRVAVEQASGPPDVPGPAGSAHLSVVVPDIAREPLSLSGIAIGRAEGRPIGGREALTDVVDHPYELALKQLPPGEYLLRVTVVAAKHTAHRDVRFTVQP